MDAREPSPAPLSRVAFGLRYALSADVDERGGRWTCLLGGGARATVSVRVVDENVARVWFHVGGARPEPPRGDEFVAEGGSFILPEALAHRPFPCGREARGGGWTFMTPKMRVEIDENPWRLAFRAPNGALLTEQIDDDADLRGNVLAPPPGFEVEGDASVPVRGVSRGFETFRLDPEDRFFGLGERFERLDKTGRSITMWSQNAYGTRSDRSHKNIPLLWTTRGHGVLVDTARRAVFHVGTKSNRTWTIEVPGDEIDYYFLAGTPAEILAAYARLTGRPNVPPRWAFGLWVSTSYQPATTESVCEKARRYRALDLPADVMTLDCTWQREMRYCDFEWDRAAFPDPGGLVDALHRDHFKVCLWENPYVSVLSDAFEEGRGRGYFLRQPNDDVYTPRLWAEGRMGYCGIVDFTNPDAVAWWRGKHGPLLDIGVDAFKTDFGEEIPADAVFHNGKTGAEMRNVYAKLFQRIAFDAVRERYGRGLIWGRAGFAGMQRYPAHWSGDPQCTYEDLAATIRAGLAAGLSGIPMWSHDIGGFWGTPTPDLYIRWAQFGLLSTLSRCHGLTHRDPWEFGDEAVEIFRRFARLRYRLIPYLYSAALDAAETGLPVMRAMVLDHPDEPGMTLADGQYYLGESLLVAPVSRADGQVTILLPPGRWLDYNNGEATNGGRLTRACALDEVPLFLPEDRMLPLGPVRSWIDATGVGPPATDPLTVDVFVRDRASFRLRGDDFARVMEARRAGDAITFESSEVGAFEVRFHRTGPPARVVADNVSVPCVEDDAAHRAAAAAWRVEGAAVVVKARARVLRLDGATEI